jgi:hypothetical protein
MLGWFVVQCKFGSSSFPVLEIIVNESAKLIADVKKRKRAPR